METAPAPAEKPRVAPFLVTPVRQKLHHSHVI